MSKQHNVSTVPNFVYWYQTIINIALGKTTIVWLRTSVSFFISRCHPDSRQRTAWWTSLWLRRAVLSEKFLSLRNMDRKSNNLLPTSFQQTNGRAFPRMRERRNLPWSKVNQKLYRSFVSLQSLLQWHCTMSCSRTLMGQCETKYSSRQLT